MAVAVCRSGGCVPGCGCALGECAVLDWRFCGRRALGVELAVGCWASGGHRTGGSAGASGGSRTCGWAPGEWQAPDLPGSAPRAAGIGLAVVRRARSKAGLAAGHRVSGGAGLLVECWASGGHRWRSRGRAVARWRSGRHRAWWFCGRRALGVGLTVGRGLAAGAGLAAWVSWRAAVRAGRGRLRDGRTAGGGESAGWSSDPRRPGGLSLDGADDSDG